LTASDGLPDGDAFVQYSSPPSSRRSTYGAVRMRERGNERVGGSVVGHHERARDPALLIINGLRALTRLQFPSVPTLPASHLRPHFVAYCNFGAWMQIYFWWWGLGVAWKAGWISARLLFMWVWAKLECAIMGHGELFMSGYCGCCEWDSSWVDGFGD
jgi:hypothetical protein